MRKKCEGFSVSISIPSSSWMGACCGQIVRYATPFGRTFMIALLAVLISRFRIFASVLETAGFKPKFRRWISMMYHNPQAVVPVNGRRLRAFAIERSVRQGCPLSPLLYVLVLEPLLRRLRDEGANLALHGVPFVGSHTARVSVFADDITVFVSCHQDIEAVKKAVAVYERIARAMINFDKSKGLQLGAWTGSDIPPGPFCWSDGPVRILASSQTQRLKVDVGRTAIRNLSGFSDLSRPWKELCQELVVGSISDLLSELHGLTVEEIYSHWNWASGLSFLNNSEFSFTWWLARNALPLLGLSFRADPADKPGCAHCGSGLEETAEHGFYYCEQVRLF